MSSLQPTNMNNNSLHQYSSPFTAVLVRPIQSSSLAAATALPVSCFLCCICLLSNKSNIQLHICILIVAYAAFGYFQPAKHMHYFVAMLYLAIFKKKYICILSWPISTSPTSAPQVCAASGRLSLSVLRRYFPAATG